MGNIFLYNKIFLLKCSNGLLDIIYQWFQEKIKAKEFEDNKALSIFVNHLNQEVHGRGCIRIDIDNYFKTAQEFECFINLFKEGIDYLSNVHNWPSEMITHTRDFYIKLLEVVEQFKKTEAKNK